MPNFTVSETVKSTMATNVHSFFSWTSILLIALVLSLHPQIQAHNHDFHPGPWKEAHATFYGGGDGSGTMDGACGFKVDEGYGLDTAAVSPVLFNNGTECGACFEIKCVHDKFCKPGAHPITITVTNLCPANPSQPSDQGGWCNPPREHFDMSQPAFLHIAEYKGGIVPIQYRRVSCKRQGGIKFTISGNPYFSLVKVTNVGGAGDVVKLEVRGKDKKHWISMSRNWGEIWHTNFHLTGQAMKFRVTTGDGTVTSWKVSDKTWQYGQTYLGRYSS